MSDITMCTGDGCPAKDKCRRHTAQKGDWQSWFQQPPFTSLGGFECDMF